MVLYMLGAITVKHSGTCGAGLVGRFQGKGLFEQVEWNSLKVTQVTFKMIQQMRWEFRANIQYTGHASK